MINKLMRYITVLVSLFCVIGITQLYARSFDDIYPDLSPKNRAAVFSKDGFLYSNEEGTSIKTNTIRLLQNSNASMLQVYNNAGNISGLKGRTYFSFTRNKNIPLFDDAVEIESEKKTGMIKKWQRAESVPSSKTLYLKLKDTNFGNTYYRADITGGDKSITVVLTNFKNINFIIFPVIKENNFVCKMYFEKVDEGLLAATEATVKVESFAGQNIDAPSAIKKRLDVIIEWILEGL
jgi:hypothetical protein